MLAIENLVKRFPARGARRGFVLDIADLVIERGEIVYLVGPNGSGKTTLFGLLLGYVSPDGGAVWLSGANGLPRMDILTLPPHRRAGVLGVVPQDSGDILVDEMTIAEHLLVGLARARRLPWLFPKTRRRREARAMVAGFGLGLDDRLGEPVGNLSGGERQLLTFCLASVTKPAMLLLDEPTGALDPEMARKVLAIVMASIRTSGLSSMIVTHRHVEAVQYADRVVVLHHGKVYQEMRKGENGFGEAQLRQVFETLYRS